jgi:hypothetical protein
MQPAPQLRVHLVLDRGQPGFVQTAAQPVADLRRRGTVQRGTGPQPQRLVQQYDLVRVGDRPGLVEEGAKPVRVNARRVGAQQISGAFPDQFRVVRCHSGRRERLTKLGDTDYHRVRRGARRRCGPAQIHQPVQRNRLVHFQGENAEDQPLPARTDIETPRARVRLDGPEHSKLQRSPGPLAIRRVGFVVSGRRL